MNFSTDYSAPPPDTSFAEPEYPRSRPTLASEEYAVAELLYREYASGIRFYLRRANPAAAAINESILAVLLQAIRKMRSLAEPVESQVTALVLEYTRKEADSIRTRPACHPSGLRDYSLPGRAELVNAPFARPDERAILMRAYLLNEPDSRIAQLTGITVEAIAEIRSQARNHFRQLASALENSGGAVN